MSSVQSSRFAGEKVLVVDDEDVIVELTALLLRGRGFEVLTASNGQECLQVVEQERPSLVLLDYMMPVMNGLTALSRIHETFPDTYVIMFTGKGNEEVAVNLMKAGAADYLQKPFVNQNLMERIDSVLQMRQVELHNRQLLKEQERLQREIEAWNQELEQRVLQKSRELEKAHLEIIQAEKLAALGHISAGMAHEIRNPLNSINLFAQILKTTHGGDEENIGYINKIVQEVGRIDNILVQMLAASKGAGRKRSLVNLVKIIDQVLDSCEVQIRAQGVRVEREFVEPIPLFESDPVEMEQIFSNLIGNALFEMQQGGTLKLALENDAETLRVRVSDTGAGIPEENLNRIFDPFFTTKTKGTGFGLSVVLRIVKGAGGRISAESSPGEGTSFIIEMPLLPETVH